MVWSERDGGTIVSPKRRLSAELLNAVDEPNCVGWSLGGRLGVSSMPVRSNDGETGNHSPSRGARFSLGLYA